MTQIDPGFPPPDPKVRADAIAKLDSDAQARFAAAQKDIAALQADDKLPVPESVDQLESVKEILPDHEGDKQFLTDFSQALVDASRVVQLQYIAAQYKRLDSGLAVEQMTVVGAVTKFWGPSDIGGV